MPALPRIVSVLLGIVLATPAVAPRVALAAQPSDDLPGEAAEETKRLNAEAQRLYDELQFVESARTYAKILEVLPENKINREERDNVLLIALGVYREAYKQQRVPGDADATRRAAKLLCTAEVHYQKYVETYQDTYGSAADPSKAARESYAKVKEKMAEAEAEIGGPPCGPPPVTKDPEVPGEEESCLDTGECLTGVDPPRGPSGTGLIVGGAVTMAAGLGAISMIVIGGLNRKKAQRVLDDDMSTDGELETARGNRRRANGLIIAGSITTGLLLAGGATMLGIGIKRRMRYMAFAPTFDRGYVGLSLQGRF